MMVQMEKQKVVYEEKALVALQKATQEKTEALSKAETLQVKTGLFRVFALQCVTLKAAPVLLLKPETSLSITRMR